MRIGIDAHIVLPEHKRYDPNIARYTEQLIENLLEHDQKEEHTWVLFFDERMKDETTLKKFRRGNVEIKHFPFVNYRKYLPVVYSHMLISSFLGRAKLDVFHSPEGLIPYLYSGQIVTTFHHVPTGESESNLFVRTFMFGARMAFAQLLKQADRIIVDKASDRVILVEKHGCRDEQVVLMEEDDLLRVDWSRRVNELMKVYADVASSHGDEGKTSQAHERALRTAARAAVRKEQEENRKK